jgi:hypothetical protein
MYGSSFYRNATSVLTWDINSVFHEHRITYIDCLAIVMLGALLNQLYRSLHPKDEKGRKGRRNAIIGLLCVLLYAIGRIILMQVNQ